MIITIDGPAGSGKGTLAKELAKKSYEEENGKGSWDDADKYEREDYHFWAYHQLKENCK